MSEMLDNIFTKNFLNLALDDPFPPIQPQHKSRLNRSASFFSPPSPPAAPSHSLSSEHIDNDDSSSSLWSSNIWSQTSISKSKQLPFRPDRSMSLTESSSTLLASLGQLKSLDGFPSVPATTVAPPPGFPASANLQAQILPVQPSNRYKTELCRGFQETGSCKYGNKCQFAHGEAELRGLFRHPKYKTEPCRTFYNFGYCPYGSRCHFIHEEKIGGGQAKLQRQSVSTTTSSQNTRHQLRQSLSFAGFLNSRSSPPPLFPSAFNDPNLGFSRASSVSPPPTDLLSPVFGDSFQRETSAFQFGHQLTHSSAGDSPNIPRIIEPKASRCVCGHGNARVFSNIEDHLHDNAMVLPTPGSFERPAGLQRFSSEDSLEDSYSSSSSSSSGGSSGTESPTFDGSATKRLTVFKRLSLSE